MADLLALSSAVIDGTQTTDDVGPMNRINFELSTIADKIAIVEAFSHCVVFETDDGLVAFDTSGPKGGERVVGAVRGCARIISIRSSIHTDMSIMSEAAAPFSRMRKHVSTPVPRSLGT